MAKKIKICANPMEIKNTCICGYSLLMKANCQLMNRDKICPNCGKKLKLIME